MKQREGGPGWTDVTERARALAEALRGAVFPLSDRQLVWLARENDAPASLLTLLSHLSGGPFASLSAVEQAVEARVGGVPSSVVPAECIPLTPR